MDMESPINKDRVKELKHLVHQERTRQELQRYRKEMRYFDEDRIEQDAIKIQIKNGFINKKQLH
jgi:hypothetical protein